MARAAAGRGGREPVAAPNTETLELLARGKQEWERTFDSLEDLVGVISRDYRFVRVNRALAERVGLAPYQVVGRHCYDVFGCPGSPPPGCPHAKALLDGKVHTNEVDNRALRGDFMVKATPLLDEAGEIWAVVCVSRDVTAYKKLLREREQLIDDLKKALAEVRTLSGLLPICCSCKRIREDNGYWQQIEQYIESRSDAEFSHGLCPDCAEELYPKYCKRN